MPDQKNGRSIITDTAKDITKELVSIAKNEPDIKDAAKNVASSLKIVTGTIKRILFPLAVLNYGYDKAEVYFSTKFQNDMAERTLKIPIENIVDPKPSLAGPALQGLAYSHNEDELKNMYLNLLASSMNSATATNTHPSYVEAIKQLSAEEAKLLKIYLKNDQLPIVKLRLIENSQNHFETVAHHILNLVDSSDKSCVVIDMLTAYVENWVRLGLVEVDYATQLVDEDAYIWVEKRPEYTNVAIPVVSEGDFQPRLEVVKGTFSRTKYGELFGRTVGIISRSASTSPSQT